MRRIPWCLIILRCKGCGRGLSIDSGFALPLDDAGAWGRPAHEGAVGGDVQGVLEGKGGASSLTCLGVMRRLGCQKR